MLVKSASGTKPHFVQRSGKSKYKCDGDCLMFKSTNGICSHTLLVAALNDEVSLFICNYSKFKAPINYMHSLLSMDYLQVDESLHQSTRVQARRLQLAFDN